MLPNSKPKILIFDIETSPLVGTAWATYDTQLLEIIDKSYILCISWQWVGEKKIHSMTAQYRKDKAVCKKLAALINKADMLVYQNGDEFDLKVARTRMLDHGMKVLKPIASVDTLKKFRECFKFPSNKLDEVCKYLGIPGKLKHAGYSMWRGCMDNNRKSQSEMAKYNRHDVYITAVMYEKIKPWIPKHPNLVALRTQGVGRGCPTCESTNIAKWGLRPTAAGVQQRMLCKDCGAYHMTRRQNAKTGTKTMPSPFSRNNVSRPLRESR